MITLHSLKASSRRYKAKRLGRGNSSGKGTTAGRGTKGQRARTGGRKKLARRGLKDLISRTPKTRGFRSLRPKPVAVSLVLLEQRFNEGSVITPATLAQAGLIDHASARVKVLGSGPLKKKLTLKQVSLSKAAADAIAKAGGTVVPLESTTKTSHTKSE